MGKNWSKQSELVFRVATSNWSDVKVYKSNFYFMYTILCILCIYVYRYQGYADPAGVAIKTENKRKNFWFLQVAFILWHSSQG